jgi:AmmeMemoRadiSam system protein A
MFPLRDSDQQTLLRIAREAVRSYLEGDRREIPEIQSGPLAELRSVFVSIHNGPDLRGCIGNLRPTAPLYKATAECAISAAVGDPRFVPLAALELPSVRFEISVLSPMEQVRSRDEIEIGTHGLLVARGQFRGLLLPQVAAEHKWDREQFLAETCRKAGLPPEDWRNGVTVYRFTANVFDEQHIPHVPHPANS